MQRQRVILDLDEAVAALLTSCAPDAHVSEGEIVERAYARWICVRSWRG